MYSYAETSELELSWLLAIVPFNIGPKYEFVSGLVQNSPKQEPHSSSNTILMPDHSAWADHSAQ